MNCDTTYDELAAWLAGDLPAEREAAVLAHLAACERCRRRVEALRRCDAALRALRPPRPSAGAVLAARRAIAAATGAAEPAEIMTLEEAAELLRLTTAQLDRIVGELPAFELGGQVRFRRVRLIEWIEQRERDYSREAAGSWAARAAAEAYERGDPR